MGYRRAKRSIYSKKASLNLSINAIVVLILAITMLGLGLGFMKKTFGGVTAQFEGVSEEMERDMADRMKAGSGRVMLNAYNVELKKGDRDTLLIGIRNDVVEGSGEFTIEQPVCKRMKEPDVECGTNEDVTVKTFEKKEIKKGEVAVMPLEIVSGPRAPSDTYLFTISISTSNNEFDETAELYVTIG